VPEDRIRFEHMIQFAGGALLAVAQVQEAVKWVKPLMEEADADMVHRCIGAFSVKAVIILTSPRLEPVFCSVRVGSGWTDRHAREGS
jgi:hypothetical protein